MPVIRWRLHLASPPDSVYRFLATAEGREAFWAESAQDDDGAIEFAFPDDSRWTGRITVADPPHRFGVKYFGDSDVLFTLEDDGAGGCDLTLTDTADDVETYAGWLSVLFALKGAVDFGIDLRNHDPARTWRERYVDN